MPRKMLLFFLLQALSVNAHVGFLDADEILKPRDVAGECSYISYAIDFCESVSPGFDTLPTSKQAPCLCYSSTSWMPGVFDNAIQTCASFASTVDPAAYSLLAPYQGFCTSAGDVLKSPAATPASTTATARSTTASATTETTPPPTTAAPSLSTGLNSNCAFVTSAFSFCESVSPGFSNFDLSSQAPCLCYSSSSWVPQSFDGPISSCADFLQTVSPSDFSVFSDLEGFCTVIGDVLKTTPGGSASAIGPALTGSAPTNSASSADGATTPAVVTKTAGPATATAAPPATATSQSSSKGSGSSGNGALIGTWMVGLLFVIFSAMLML